MSSPGKSDQAFRTISEVSSELDLPQHVLRFWETKFHQVAPLKRGGGRRYYRPHDVELLRRIKSLLHTEGFTIKGVQRLLSQGSAKLGGESTAPQMPPAKPSVQRADDGKLAGLIGELEDIRDLLKKT